MHIYNTVFVICVVSMRFYKTQDNDLRLTLLNYSVIIKMLKNVKIRLIKNRSQTIIEHIVANMVAHMGCIKSIR